MVTLKKRDNCEDHYRDKDGSMIIRGGMTRNLTKQQTHSSRDRERRKR